MSIQFKPKETLGWDEQSYDAKAWLLKSSEEKGDVLIAHEYKKELLKLDKEWAKQGEQ